MFKLSFTLIGALQLINKMGNLIPADKMLRKLTLRFERDVKKATVVGVSGFARGTITHSIKYDHGEVMSHEDYYPFIEYGTYKMMARHMEGRTKVTGWDASYGAFHYTAKKFWDSSGDIMRDIVTKIEGVWRK